MARPNRAVKGEGRQAEQSRAEQSRAVPSTHTHRERERERERETCMSRTKRHIRV